MAQQKQTTDSPELERLKKENADLRRRLENAERPWDGLFSRVLVDLLPQRIFLKDTQSVYLACNANYARDLGMEPAQVVGLDDYDLFEPELASKYRADDREVVQSGITKDLVEHYPVDGEMRWISTIKVPFRDQKGRVAGVLGLFDDITERKLEAEALEKRLTSLTMPQDTAEAIAFEDLFNLEDIQLIQDAFAEATGVASLITRPDGTPITRPSNFSRLCSEIIRRSELGLANCRRSDAILGRCKPEGPIVERCLSGGLWDAGASITVGGRHIANWLVGQVRDEAQSDESMREYARRIGVDEDRLIEAFHEVPVMPRRQFALVARALHTLAKQLSQSAYQNIQQARFIVGRQKAEEALRDSQENLAQIIEFLPDATFVIDRQGKVISWNRAMAELTGIAQEDILGRGDYAYAVPFYGKPRPVSIDLVLEGDSKLADTYFAYEEVGDTVFSETHLADFRGRGSTYLWNTASRLRNARGEVIGAIESIRDVTEQRQAEEALQVSEQRYRELLDSVSDLIFTQDLEGRFTSFNAALSKILGYSRDELLGVKARELMRPELADDFEGKYLAGLKAEGVAQGVTLYFHKNGDRRYLEYRSQLVHDPDGDDYISGIARDVSERVKQEKRLRHLQNQLMHTQKMEAVGTLAGGIAHDFNNLLAAIMGYAELAQQDAETGEDNQEAIDHILGAAERARDLVRKILTFSRKMEIDQRPLNLNRVILQTMDILERTLPKMIRLESNLSKDLEPVNADPNQMEQILLNLAGNAADAMPDGGRLVFETANVVLGRDLGSEHLEIPPGPYVQLTVSDTGPGIEAAIRERIFEPFFTTKEPGKGTGLGLATVYGVVSYHGGGIYCYSEPGQGTSFKIYLPAHRGGARSEEAQDGRPEEMPGGHEHLLVVDDEKTLRDLQKTNLEKMGYRVSTAASGEKALELYAALRPRPDLVILDLNMPGMGGHRALEGLLALDPSAKVIIASGYSFDGKVKDTLAAGAAAFIAKPFRWAELLTTLRRVLDRPKPSSKPSS